MPTVKMTPEGHKRLTEAMEERRKELRLRWQDVAAAASLSVETLSALRRPGAQGVRDLTLRAVDAGLQWYPGSAERTLKGDAPAPLGNGQPSAGDEPPPHRLDDGFAAIEATVEWMRGLTPTERAAALGDLVKRVSQPDPNPDSLREAGLQPAKPSQVA